MTIVIRVDASIQIGSGHVMRCLTLADELNQLGEEIIFICRELNGHMAAAITQRGYQTKLLPPLSDNSKDARSGSSNTVSLKYSWQKDAADVIECLDGLMIPWLIVDHYDLDHKWQTELRPHCEKIMVIDDLADRVLDCDMLLDQTHGRPSDAYRSLTSPHCHRLLGARFALLRPEFQQLRTAALQKRNKFDGLKDILVFVGGADPDNLTGAILDLLSDINWEQRPKVTVVIDAQTPIIEKLHNDTMHYRLPVAILKEVTNMATLMLSADLSIGAAGTTSWERCALGLPSLITVLEKNQEFNAKALHDAGAAVVWKSMDDLKRHIEKLDQDRWFEMSTASAKICDGNGCHRVAREIYAAES